MLRTLQASVASLKLEFLEKIFRLAVLDRKNLLKVVLILFYFQLRLFSRVLNIELGFDHAILHFFDLILELGDVFAEPLVFLTDDF